MIDAIESMNEIFFQRLHRGGERVMSREHGQRSRSQALARRRGKKHHSAARHWIHDGLDGLFLRRQEPNLRDGARHGACAVKINAQLLSSG